MGATAGKQHEGDAEHERAEAKVRARLSDLCSEWFPALDATTADRIVAAAVVETRGEGDGPRATRAAATLRKHGLRALRGDRLQFGPEIEAEMLRLHAPPPPAQRPEGFEGGRQARRSRGSLLARRQTPEPPRRERKAEAPEPVEDTTPPPVRRRRRRPSPAPGVAAASTDATTPVADEGEAGVARLSGGRTLKIFADSVVVHDRQKDAAAPVAEPVREAAPEPKAPEREPEAPTAVTAPVEAPAPRVEPAPEVEPEPEQPRPAAAAPVPVPDAEPTRVRRATGTRSWRTGAPARRDEAIAAASARGRGGDDRNEKRGFVLAAIACALIVGAIALVGSLGGGSSSEKKAATPKQTLVAQANASEFASAVATKAGKLAETQQALAARRAAAAKRAAIARKRAADHRRAVAERRAKRRAAAKRKKRLAAAKSVPAPAPTAQTPTYVPPASSAPTTSGGGGGGGGSSSSGSGSGSWGGEFGP